MGKSIQFNGQIEFRAEKVNNKLIHRPLAVKVKTVHLLFLQVLPEYDFRFCAIVSEISCELFELRVIWNDWTPHAICMRHILGKPYRMFREIFSNTPLCPL